MERTKTFLSNDDLDLLIQEIKDLYQKNKPPLFLEIEENLIRQITIQVISILEKEKSLVEIKAPVYIVGDIHGQFYDLLRLFRSVSFPDKQKYLFLGDYVDRGKQSLECILILYLYKIRYPNNIILLRGNHECSSLTKQYGFYDECKRRVSTKAWKYFCDSFMFLPISALIEKKVLCMHGGLGPEMKIYDIINKIKRPCEIPDEGLLCDLLWADPCDSLIDKNFDENQRGISVVFSSLYLKKFLNINNLDLIVRGHQVVEDGYEFFGDQGLVTVFSAPNYTGVFDNNGAILHIDESLICSFNILKGKVLNNKSEKDENEKQKNRSQFKVIN